MLIVLILVASPAAVQQAGAQLPETDIWLADLRVDGDSIRVSSPRPAVLRPGYDNQPCFLPGGNAFLFASADSSGQTDVYRWDGPGARLSRVTATPESEYSPTPLDAPEGGFCAVRVEADSTQRLWRFDADGGHPRPVMDDVDSVGYFAWVDARTIAVFVVGKPHTLRLVNVDSQSETVVARDIGRSILRVPGARGVSFQIRQPDDTYTFYLLPSGGGKAARLIEAEGTGQDAAWIGEVLVMASGSKLFAAHPFTAAVWREVTDLAAGGIASVSRIAVSPDHRRMALVATAAP